MLRLQWAALGWGGDVRPTSLPPSKSLPVSEGGAPLFAGHYSPLNVSGFTNSSAPGLPLPCPLDSVGVFWLSPSCLRKVYLSTKSHQGFCCVLK